MPQLSIVLPTYNSSEYLVDTISSILDQDYSDFELIIIDDHSTDDTESVLSSFNDDRINYIRLDKNHGGPSRPRNIGISAASGEYVAFFDSDDIMASTKLSKCVDILNRFSNVSLVFTDAYKVDSQGNTYSGTLLQDYEGLRSKLKSAISANCYLIDRVNSYKLLFIENFIPTSSVVVRREVIDLAGKFDESLTNGDDRDMWYRITKNNDIAYIDLPLHYYRVRSGSVSGRGIVAAKNKIIVLEKQLLSGIRGELYHNANKLIAENYYGIGYAFRRQGDMSNARKYYVESLRRNFSMITLRSYLATFLGKNILFWIRHG